MSFVSIGDGVQLLQLAWNTLQGARQACGQYDALTREVASLHTVLQRVQRELVKGPESTANNERLQELHEHVAACSDTLRVMDAVLRKYNALSGTSAAPKRLWQKIRFGNGELKDLSAIRLQLSTHTAAIGMSLKLCVLGKLGEVEARLEGQEGDLRGIRSSIDWIAA
ncbi:hypothetical protein LSUE1_G007717, partial [Lachnellula suecica]